MKKFLFVPLLAVFTVFCSFMPATQWETYTSAEGHFSISFPGKPEESSQDDRTEDNVIFKIHLATVTPSDDEVYMTGWIDMHSFYPKDKTIKQLLEDSRDGATASMRATKVTTLATELGDKPYIEFTFETEEFTGKDRIYVINKYQYSIITIFALKTGILPTADKFISSFKPM